MLKGKTILLIISGGIAAYKSLELIRLLKKSDVAIRCILTAGGQKFITPLSVASLSEHPCYTDLWSLTDETDMGHIRLSRESDLIVVAPASANIIARMAQGMADDLATTTLLASDKKIMLFPAMNPLMWSNPATQANIETLRARGVIIIDPAQGDMACGETGTGRLPEATEMIATLNTFFDKKKALSGYKALVTAGPTHEPLDPVRYIGNRSSGKQGYAIAQALADEGAEVTLISGPTSLTPPPGVTFISVETAQEMMSAALNTLPCNIAVCTAAVADWRPDVMASQKIKKQENTPPQPLTLVENPDILKTISTHPAQRPALVVGFAAETDQVIPHAQHKRISKKCDWILANDVTQDVFGTDNNQVIWCHDSGAETWPKTRKSEIAQKLVEKIILHFSSSHSRKKVS
ncbi:MAG: bifunctional phosphopantothenoylcysteine decarboxylase/phosphopantothenate--cysteine ligase CoaBC [Alphaproteobacteria bacterium]|nr:bifunctional phosphopantothenoylcysteine decarboxylase/phosphopantothenate--cysteine ligase CoaBC [Alphaproteobacteria bacterium]